ncbi:MAG: hypothetical protein RML45_01785 [Acetobacteraceae bacterium]|nr:hypothetical protein [Acetobacteraceae bacterium]
MPAGSWCSRSPPGWRGAWCATGGITTTTTTPPGTIIVDDHGHDDAPHHSPPPAAQRVGWRTVIATGFGGGLAPCPGALVVLALALQAGAAALGVAMVAAFSLGLGVVLSGAALAAALSLRLASPVRTGSRFTRLAAFLPWASVAVMAAAGFYTLCRAGAALAQGG